MEPKRTSCHTDTWFVQWLMMLLASLGAVYLIMDYIGYRHYALFPLIVVAQIFYCWRTNHLQEIKKILVYCVIFALLFGILSSLFPMHAKAIFFFLLAISSAAYAYIGTNVYNQLLYGILAAIFVCVGANDMNKIKNNPAPATEAQTSNLK